MSSPRAKGLMFIRVVKVDDAVFEKFKFLSLGNYTFHTDIQSESLQI